MKYKTLKTVCSLFCVLLLFIPCFSVNAITFTDITDTVEQTELQDLMTDDIIDYFDSQPISISQLQQMNFTDFLKLLVEEISKNIKKPLLLFLKLCGVFVLAGIFSKIKDGQGDKGVQNAINMVVTISIFILVCNPSLQLLSQVEAALFTSKNAMISFVPIFTSAMVSCGQPATALIYGGIFLSMMTICATMLIKYVLPFVKIFMALCITQGVNKAFNLNSIISFISKAIKWVLGLLATIFVAILSFQTFISQGADSVTMRAGKFLVGSTVPVIGRALSEAIGTVFSGLQLIKGMVGISGIVGILILCLPVLISCICYQIIFYASKAVAEILDNKQASSVLQGFCECISIYIAIILFFALLLIFSTIIMLMAGGASK